MTTSSYPYQEFFHILTRSPFPYHYQEALFRELRGQNNIVLRAPTGSGKTWAVVAPFLYDWFTSPPQKRWADRMIYALPLRSLASDLYVTVEKGLERIAKADGATVAPPRIALQMGGQQDDPYFEADLIFTTIDQLLSGYILNPVSIGERAANIPAGALPGSIIVIDEIHLLEPARSLATLLEMTQRLHGLTQTVLMSATIPNAVGSFLAQTSNSIWMALGDDEVRALPSHCSRQRSLQWVDHPLSAEDVLREHSAGGRTAIVVNSVGRAQRLYRDLRDRLSTQSDPPTPILLHSRFYPEDRKRHEEMLRLRMGPEATEANVILISTQVVEAGLDFSADSLLTELAPMNSLIQRAGRVARYPGRNTGRIFVFALETTDAGTLRLGPYHDQAKLVAATQEVLTREQGDVGLDYPREIAWLNAVHEKGDLTALQAVHLGVRAAQVSAAMNGDEPSARARLIRDTDAVALVITSEPEELTFTRFHVPPFLSVPRTSLWPLESSLRTMHQPVWVMKSARQNDDTDSERDGTFSWARCETVKEAGWLAAVHPDFAAYSPDIGLELGLASDGRVVPASIHTDRLSVRYGYHREDWSEHARTVAEIAGQLLADQPVLQERMHRAYPHVDLTEILRITALLHDAGKLSAQWQHEAKQWEFIRTGIAASGALAHTTFNPETDARHPQRPRFPPHAMEGAYTVHPWVYGKFSDEEQAQIVLTAIARHHAPFAKQLRDFRLTAEAVRELSILLGEVPELADPPEPLTRNEFYFCMMDPTHGTTATLWPVYLAVVRLLRLADQKATARHNAVAVH